MNKEKGSIKVNAVSPEFMDIEAMKNCINTYLNKSDSIVRTLYEVLFFGAYGSQSRN